MTVNVRESIQKIMGWCPNANALLTKRVLITLPAGEEFMSDERGNGGMNPIKMGWGYEKFLKWRPVALPARAAEGR